MIYTLKVDKGQAVTLMLSLLQHTANLKNKKTSKLIESALNDAAAVMKQLEEIIGELK